MTHDDQDAHTAPKCPQGRGARKRSSEVSAKSFIREITYLSAVTLETENSATLSPRWTPRGTPRGSPRGGAKHDLYEIPNSPLAVPQLPIDSAENGADNADSRSLDQHTTPRDHRLSPRAAQYVSSTEDQRLGPPVWHDCDTTVPGIHLGSASTATVSCMS